MLNLLFLPLIVLALLLTVGLILVLAHILPHLAGLIVVGLILVLCVMPLLKHAAQEAPVPQQAGAPEPNPRDVAAQRDREPHDAKSEANDATKQADTLADQPVDPTVRPGWVDQPAHFDERRGFRVATAASGLYSTLAECEQELSRAIDTQIDDFVRLQFGNATVKLDPLFVAEHLIRARWQETVDKSVGPMQQEYAFLVFDGPVRAEIDRRWRETAVAERLRYAGTGAAALLLLVGGVYSVLKWWPAGKPRALA